MNKTNRKLPNEQECLTIMEKYEMLPNIVRHSIQVKNVAMAIVHNLKDSNSINEELVLSSALLHDIAKTKSIKDKTHRHDLEGGKIARELGYPDIAFIIESHVLFLDFQEKGKLEEREIVFYADKRVMHDKIVSLDERIDDLVIRYGVNNKVKELIKKNKKFILKIENKINSFLRDDLKNIIDNI